MNVVRMNTAHATPEGLRKIIHNVRAVSPHIGILIDTKGPEVRTTGIAQPITYKTGEVVKIFGRPEMDTTHDIINVSFPDFALDVKAGDDILFDDGAIDMKVQEIVGPTVYAEVQNDGVLGAHKSVNVPGEHIDLPALTERDRRNILLAIDEDIDFIAHSFVRSAADVEAVQKILDEHHSDIKIISKIENQEGVDNIDEIIRASYGVMVARGDLGIEVPVERIPGIQRSIIRKCVEHHKPVIVATQMLHTMINNPRPTRAEVTDIANAIYSNTDALMLSGETASGKYPLEAVKTMALIAETTENNINYKARFSSRRADQNGTVAEAIAHATVTTAHDLNARAIITVSLGGQTARLISKYRPSCPIISCTMSEVVCRQMNMSWGVIPFIIDEKNSTDDLFDAAVEAAESHRLVQDGDLVAITAGVPLGVSGTTNLMKVEKIGGK
jgi:pyruvate kinase